MIKEIKIGGKCIGINFIDCVVEDKIVLELKKAQTSQGKI